MKIMEIETNVFVNAEDGRARPRYTHKGVGFFKVGTDAQFYREADDWDEMPSRMVRVLGRSKEECREIIDTLHMETADLHLVESVTGLIDEVM